jgi:hypothetical protein
MLDFLLHSANLPFAIALGIMIGIGLLEGISTLLGAGLSSLLDSILPDFDFDVDMDVDADADLDALDSGGALSHFFGWLHVGKVPVLILFILFLCGFGTAGLVLQSFASNTFGFLLPPWLASVPAVLAALFGMRWAGRLFIRWFGTDETQAVSESSFVGRIAVITLGAARAGSPSQAKLRDEHGQTHYVMVEPEDESETFPAGAEVLLIGRKGVVFLAAPNTTGISFQDMQTP